MNTNLKDIGWMCHVTPLRKHKTPAFMPPISQIPEIGGMPEEPSSICQQKITFKSTDSPYVQLCKLGGRADLLCFKENQPNKGSALPYCRCDWYYLEDNAKEDRETAKPVENHVFKVPFYMTHGECKQPESLTKPIVETVPPPVQGARKSAKCGKLPPHRPGYADYNKKLNKIKIEYSPPEHKETVHFPKYDVAECDPTTMPKLLANAYRSDYDSYRKQWQEIERLYKDKDCCLDKLEPRKTRPKKKSHSEH